MDRFASELKDAGKNAEVDLQKKYDEVKAAAQKLKAEAGKKERWEEVETSLKKRARNWRMPSKRLSRRRVISVDS